MVTETGFFGVTLLAESQQMISDRFAGKIPDDGNRFEGITVLHMAQNIPVLRDGLGQLACCVIHKYEMPLSTLFVGEVLEACVGDANSALVYSNRKYHKLEL
jgi:flavin reductase (DIM6/NTAB) family NADH-FMN oxidoreductase RutF